MKQKAFCWYRPNYEPFAAGKVLNLITSEQFISYYVHEPSHMAIMRKQFPSGLTVHGLSMLPARTRSADDFWEPVIETVFELVRQLHYPDAPSRFTSLYASHSLEQAEQWRALWLKNFGCAPSRLIPTSLWKIEYDTDARAYDASWLSAAVECEKNVSKFSYLLLMDSAQQYWSGKFQENSMPELLIPFPVTILCERRVGPGRGPGPE